MFPPYFIWSSKVGVAVSQSGGYGKEAVAGTEKVAVVILVRFILFFCLHNIRKNMNRQSLVAVVIVCCLLRCCGYDIFDGRTSWT